MGNSNNIGTHSNIIIGDRVYTWGGHKPGQPLVHDSPQKRQFTSSISVYSILQSSLDTRQTTGSPPNGTIDYSSCCIGEDIYYFGGCCEVDNCFHNNLFVLNTERYTWKEIDCNEGPMKKAICRMIPVSVNGEDYLVVVGGYGPIPARDTPHQYQYTPHQYQYTPHPANASLCITNEVHVMCVSSTPGKWTVPMMTGSAFPPLLGFSINTLSCNRAIVFGGSRIEDQSIVRTNDVFIFTYSATDNSLSIERPTKPSDPSIDWPVGSNDHSSAIVTSLSNGKPHLLVMGGLDNNIDIIPCTWMLNIESMRWTKVALTEVVSKRFGHSMTCFRMSVNCVWLLVTGGLNSDKIFAVFSSFDNAWSASLIMNEKDMKNKVQYSRVVSNHLMTREKEYQLMMGSITTEFEMMKTKEQQIILLKQQLEQKDEENIQIRKEMKKKLKTKDQVIMNREETIKNKESLFQELIRQKNDVIFQKDKDLQQTKCEISNLQSQLESFHWVIQDEEVNVMDAIVGKGSYGEVRVAIFRGARVAAKLLHELIVSRHNKDIFTREMEISSRIHHPNIVQFIGATRINNPILLYELMPTSLHKRLQDDKSLTHAQIVSIGSNICTAMCYLHQWRPQPIIHRDISSPNVLMEPLPNDQWRAKLSDFGSANLQLHIKTVVPGNPFYSALEADNPRLHSPAMDVYSFGVLLTEMVLHRAPEIDRTRLVQTAHSIDWMEIRVIVLNCINNDCNQRLSSKQLLVELQKL